MRTKVVVERERDGERISCPPSLRSIEQPGRRNHVIRGSEVIQLRFEELASEGGEELVLWIPRRIADAVVDESNSHARR